MHALTITIAESADDYRIARALIESYMRELPVDLAFQNADRELAALETMYGPPDGRLLLARRGNDVAGCVAIRAQGDGACEMKRLYLLPHARGGGSGRALAEAAIETARQMGYRTMRLDTLASMTAAQQLYRTLGFREIAPYYANPHPAVFLELDLC